MAPTCVFCDIVNGTAPASIVYTDDLAVASADIQAVNDGHLLVAPRAHVGSLAEMDVGVGFRPFRQALNLAQMVRQSGIRCEGVNQFLADGEAAGQEIKHVHLHVVPCFLGDGFGMHFSEEYYELPGRVSLDPTAGKIRQAVEG